MSRNKSKQARRAERWAKKRRGVNWDLVWKILASISAFIVSMVAAYELVDYFRSDSKTFYSIIFPGLAIVIWFIVLIQLIRKKNPYVMPLLAFTAIGGLVGGIGWQSYNQTQEDKVIVLVAQFDGPEETYGLRRQMMEDLREATKDYDDTIIIEGDQLVTSSEYARELGGKAKADLVIWVWYRPIENPNITIHIENLSPEQIQVLNKSEIYNPQSTLAQLQSFEIQRKIGSETSTLISFLTGMLSYKSGNFRTATERFEKILAENDMSTFIRQDDLYFNLGYSNFQLGKYEASIQYNDKVIQINPQLAAAYNNRGAAYYYSQKLDQAYQDFDKAIELSPQYPDAYNNRGAIHAEWGEAELAIKDFSKAIEFNPQYADAYYNRGKSYLDLGSYNSAIEDFNTAIEMKPKFVWAYASRGIAYDNLREYELALKDYDKAIKIDSNYAITYHNRGVVYFELEWYELAIKDFDKAIKLNQNYADAYRNRGLVYQKVGKTTEAEADFKKYEELTGQKPPINTLP